MKKKALLLAAGMTAFLISGCSNQTDEVAYVESVGMICGIGPVGMTDTFAGVITPQSETEIHKSGEEAIGEVRVSVGDEVKADQVLFVYDSDQAKINLEKAKLELEQMKNTISSKKKEKAALEKEKKNASSDQKLQYTLEIQEADAAILEAEYNLSAKEQEVEKLAAILNSLEVKSPIAGVVQSINEGNEMDEYGNPKPYMVIVETGAYKVKGYVNENNAAAVAEGTPVLIHSRVDDATWEGTVTMIDWDNPMQQENMYYAEEDTVASSRYAFYVELVDDEGLMMGQHVYMEMNYGDGVEAETGIPMPAYYINDVDSDPWVWAKGKNGKLEKREIELGEYLEDMDTYLIENGLEAADYIAFPDDLLKEGMKCEQYDEASIEEGAVMEEGITTGEVEVTE